jgi:hypothetical protein
MTVTTSPPGADVYYTTDGTDPTAGSAKYAGPVALTIPQGRTARVKIMAWKSGLDAGAESKLAVPTAKDLPAGYLKEMLCLDNTQGASAVLSADTGAVYAKYAGENKAIPFEGDQVIANGRTYTWHVRSTPDSSFSATAASSFTAFWYINIISPSVQTAKLGMRFNEQPKIWCNGHLIVDLYAWDGNNEWILGGGPYGFGLDQGANGILIRMLSLSGSTARFGARFLNPNPQDIVGGTGTQMTNLKYFLSGGASIVSGTPARDMNGDLSLRISGNKMNIRLRNGGEARIVLMDALGTRMGAAQTRAGSADLPLDRLARGIYFVRISDGSTQITKRILAGQALIGSLPLAPGIQH